MLQNVAHAPSRPHGNWVSGIELGIVEIEFRQAYELPSNLRSTGLTILADKLECAGYISARINFEIWNSALQVYDARLAVEQQSRASDHRRIPGPQNACS